MADADGSRLKILILGGGIAGLATAFSIIRHSKFDVTVLESHSDLTEHGAGIQITPNASKVLCEWGLRKDFEEIALQPDVSEVRRYSDGQVLGKILYNDGDYAEQMYESPHWVVHRADYQQVLAKAAVRAGTNIMFGKRIVRVNCDEVEAVLEDGNSIGADLIVGADGIWSQTRKSIPENSNIKPLPAEEYCYRFLVPREKMESNNRTAALVESNRLSMVYAGPRKAMICYPVANGELYNVALPIARPSDAPVAAYNEPGDILEMREQFQDFDETVQILMRHTDSCAKWALADLAPLPAWSSENGRVVLVGDAAHAMLPWAASGGGTAIEDAAVLGELLAACTSATDLAAATNGYETLRRKRCERIQQMSRENKKLLTMVNGAEQEERDRKLTERMHAQEKSLHNGDLLKLKPVPSIDAPYPSPPANMWLYGYDGITEAQEYLRRSQ